MESARGKLGAGSPQGDQMYAYWEAENGVFSILPRKDGVERKVRGFCAAAVVVVLFEGAVLWLMLGFWKLLAACTHHVVALLGVPLWSHGVLRQWYHVQPCRLAMP